MRAASSRWMRVRVGVSGLCVQQARMRAGLVDAPVSRPTHRSALIDAVPGTDSALGQRIGCGSGSGSGSGCGIGIGKRSGLDFGALMPQSTPSDATAVLAHPIVAPISYSDDVNVTDFNAFYAAYQSRGGVGRRSVRIWGRRAHRRIRHAASARCPRPLPKQSRCSKATLVALASTSNICHSIFANSKQRLVQQRYVRRLLHGLRRLSRQHCD